MASNSSGERKWSAWNPLTGCTKISAGCKHCYAERMAARLQEIGSPKYENGFRLTLHEDLVERPLTWKKPRVIFVNSMSDLFHRDVPPEFILRVFDTMRRASWHTFHALTKRSDRLLEMDAEIDWPPNVWMGVTVEDQPHAYRADDLRRTGAQHRFLSVEPLVGPIPRLNLEGIDWVWLGGETGPGARPMKEEWAIQVRDACMASGVAFSFRGWGGDDKRRTGRLLENRAWDERPLPRLGTGEQLSLF